MVEGRVAGGGRAERFVATDLHGHTSFSDGRVSPEVYVTVRRDLGMHVVAIADHDTFAGVRRGAVAAERAGIAFIPASEITCFFHFGEPEAEQVHLLAYFSPDVLAHGRLERTMLYRRGLRVQQIWRDFVLGWVSSLPRDARDAIDPAMELARLPAAEFPALQSFRDRIQSRARPLFPRFHDEHVRFWNGERELFGWSPDEAIDAIRNDGAIDIVAHPARYRDADATADLLEQATGLEVYSSRHTEADAAKLRAFAETHAKLWTASTDDPQNARNARPNAGSPLTTIERILGRPLPPSMILAA